MQHYPIKAPTKLDALRQAKKVCRCKRTSFEGVKWFDNEAKEWNYFDWNLIDNANQG